MPCDYDYVLFTAVMIIVAGVLIYYLCKFVDECTDNSADKKKTPP